MAALAVEAIDRWLRGAGTFFFALILIKLTSAGGRCPQPGDQDPAPGGLVRGGHYRRRRRVEFLDFMNRTV
jgi:hypothetical protein